MDGEIVFRALFILGSIVMMAIRLYYQSKVLRDRREIEIREDSFSLIAGSVAALTAIVFGVEYMFFPGCWGPHCLNADWPDWMKGRKAKRGPVGAS
jgi:hypothetical protein